MTFPSIFIPKIFNNITEHIIRKVFDNHSFGIIRSVEIINKTNHKNEKYKSAVIHLVWNTNNHSSYNTRNELLNGKSVNIMYNNPWFWKIYMYVPKHNLPAIITTRDTFAISNNTDQFGRDIQQRFNPKVVLPEIAKVVLPEKNNNAYYSWADAEDTDEEEEEPAQPTRTRTVDFDQPATEEHKRTINYAGAFPIPTMRRRKN